MMLSWFDGVVLAASTKFLCRFNTSTPNDEATSTAGTLVGNASCDTANSRLQTDGTGDWCTFPSSSVFDLAGDFTLEMHTDQAAAQVGGIVARNDVSTGGSPRWAIYCAGDGSASMYCDAISGSALLTITGLNGSEHHLAFVRESNTWRCYKDGVQASTTTSAGTIGSAVAKDLYIGTDPFAPTSRDIQANIGRIKISDVCLYPSGTSFTPPARTDV